MNTLYILGKQIDSWASKKTESVKKEAVKVRQYEADIEAVKTKCTQILRSGDVVVEREKKISSIIDCIFNDHSHFDRPLEYITEHTKLAAIDFDPETTTIAQLASYGNFSENEVNPIIDIPTITLDAPTKTVDTDNGYKVRMKWKMTKEPENINDFAVRFRISNNDDDEKKEVDEWRVAKHEQIERVLDRQFTANIADEFAFDTKYLYKVGLKLSQPFPMEITSNVTEFQIDGAPNEDVVQIPLEEYSGLEKELYESDLPRTTEEMTNVKREEVFVKKLHLCQAKCDFCDTSDKMIELIGKKESMLLELSEFISLNVWFKEALFETCLKTVSQNLFRALPFQDRPPGLSSFHDEVFEDPTWRHLKLVYNLMWNVINTPQVTSAMIKKHMKEDFLENLVDLFASEDHREREYLTQIMHKIYGRCIRLRPFIIDIMSRYLNRMIDNDECQHVNGIDELLRIICAVISGLTVPVKDSWRLLVRNLLVPLHKVECDMTIIVIRSRMCVQESISALPLSMYFCQYFCALTMSMNPY